jgi:hypothetical protein
MLQKVGENIRVAAIHGPGKSLSPVWFDWRRRKHEVREITYRWRHSAGDELFLHFSVSDGSALYELVYNTAEQLWTLESMDADEP